MALNTVSLAPPGPGGVLVLLMSGAVKRSDILSAVAVTFGAHAVVAAAATRGRHLAWLVFAGVAFLCWFGR